MVDYASFKGRMTISGTLKLMSPMHIGSGFSVGLHAEKDANEKNIEVGGIVLGVGGRPVIPSTSLKGAMRALLEQAGTEQEIIETLFGAIKSSNAPGNLQDTGRQGCLAPLTATLERAGDTNEKMGVVLAKNIKGAVLAQRTAIDGSHGVPEKGKLFVRQQLVPGATFSFRMNLMGDAFSLDTETRLAIASLLATLKSNGLNLGSGRGDGNGLLKLEEGSNWDFQGIRVKGGEIKNLDANEIRTSYGSGRPLAQPGAVFRLTLSTDDPFFILSSKTDDVAPNRPDGANNTLKALRTADGLPELPATSLMGALRASAEWYEALHAMRSGENVPERTTLLAEIFGARADELIALAPDLAGNINARQPGRKRKITAAEITGFAGMLRVKSIKPGAASITTIPSVRIDRFTQSPMDRALFEAEAFVGPSFSVELALDHRADEEHRMFVTDFLAHLSSAAVNSGLMLGHATNRGYGWFKVALAG